MAEKPEKKTQHAKSQEEIVICEAVMVHEPISQVVDRDLELEAWRVVEDTVG